MIRALHLLPATAWAGTEKQAYYLLRELPSLGVQPELAIFRRGRGHVRFAELPVPIHEIGAGRRVSRELPQRVRQTRALIADRRPDLVHSWLFESHLVALLARRRTGLGSLVLSQRSESSMDGAGPYIFAIRLMRRRVDLVLANSDGAAAMARAMGFGPERLMTIPNGHPACGSSPPGSRNAVRSRLGIGRDEELIITIGRPNRGKGYGTLLSAMEMVRERRRNARLAFVGPTRAELAAIGFEVPAWAEPLGWRDDLDDLLDAADCVAHPSDSESRSNAVEEALLRGRPVVSTDTGAHVATVRSSGGKVVPAGEPGALATAIEAILDDPPAPGFVTEAAGALTSCEQVARLTAQAYQRVHRP